MKKGKIQQLLALAMMSGAISDPKSMGLISQPWDAEGQDFTLIKTGSHGKT